MKINDLRRAVLKRYADGDFAHLAEQEEISRAEINELGDSLLVFVLIELSEEEGCDDVTTGIQRLTSGRDDLDIVLVALEALQAATGTTIREGEA